jgi:hypothetical protein
MISNYGQIENGMVANVIVADADFIAQSNVNYVLLTRGGIGWTYNSTADVFIAPQPYPSWTLDSNFDWQPPTPMPSTGGPYRWSEEELAWVAIQPSG